MQKILSADEMREVDRLTVEGCATPSLLLMEAAATGAAAHIAARLGSNLTTQRIQILCGPGNNGGDGAALARALWRMEAQVDVVLCCNLKATHGDARINFEIVKSLAESDLYQYLEAARISFSQCETVADWSHTLSDLTDSRYTYGLIVDALFGTGLGRPLNDLHCAVVNYINTVRQQRARNQTDVVTPLIVALDLPSGLSADTATPVTPDVAVHADLTITFTAPKPANVLPPAVELNGELVIVPVGSPERLIDAAPSKLFVIGESDAREWLSGTRYAFGSYKNTHGHVLVVAGSRDYTGAAVLTSEAAMRAGAGLVTIATARSAVAPIAARITPEVITAELPETADGAISLAAVEPFAKLRERATVIAVGPGLSSTSTETRDFVRHVVKGRTTLIVVDADGLNSLAPWPEDLPGRADAPLILTPHWGEMRRLVGDDDSLQTLDRVSLVREFAVKHELILVLKGARTLVGAPDGRVFINPTGNPGLGTAGAGDTLTGIITSFTAQALAIFKETKFKEAEFEESTSSAVLSIVLEATLAALYVSGLAGDIAARTLGMRTMLASDVREHFGQAVRTLDQHGEQP